MELRTPCSCGGATGTINTRSGQDCVYCNDCRRWQYNAPRTETGREVRSLASRPDIKPSLRAAILAEHDHACVSCGRHAPDVVLELDHLISREDAERNGFLDDPIIDSRWNLAPMCQECNSGKRMLGSVGVRLMYRLLQIKAELKESAA